MSSSPKYTSVRLQAERRRDLQERRRRQERLQGAKDAAEAEARSVRQQAESLVGTVLWRFVTPELNSLRERLAAAAGEASSATDEAQVRRAAGSMAALREELRRVEARAQAAEFAEHLAREEAAVRSLACRIAAVDGARSAKFDPGVLCQVEGLATQASEALARTALDRVRRLVAAAESRLEQHLSTVGERFGRWAERRDQAEAAAATVHDRIAGLRADEVVRRWAAPELAALESRGEVVSRLLAAERFGAAEAECGRVLGDAQSVVGAAQLRQLKEDEKQHVVCTNADTTPVGDEGLQLGGGVPARRLLTETAGLHNFAAVMELRFSRVGYFTVTAGAPPSDALAPLTWIVPGTCAQVGD